MKGRRIIIILAATWVVVLIVFAQATRHDRGERSTEFLMDMAHSPAYEAQEGLPKPACEGPASGAIARGHMPHRFAADEEGLKRAGDGLTAPFPSDASTLQRGERVYVAWCAACHGATGLGDGTVTKRGVPPPPSLLAEAARKLRDGEIYHIITVGRKNMPAHRALVARDDRWKVIHFIREMQEAGP